MKVPALTPRNFLIALGVWVVGFLLLMVPFAAIGLLQDGGA